MSHYPIRYRLINDRPLKASGPIVLWLTRDLRSSDNWALIKAIELANANHRSVLVVYNLIVNYLNGSKRQWDFKIRSLIELSKNLKELGVGFHLVDGDGGEVIDFLKANQTAGLITDFCPLKPKRQALKQVVENFDGPIYEVDAHNIVPVWIASNKQEFAAYTIRPKIKKLLPIYLTDFPRLVKPLVRSNSVESIDFDSIIHDSRVDDLVSESGFEPGEAAAKKTLKEFIGKRLSGYSSSRNDPNQDAQSNLSPYLHYGLISPQRVAWEVAHCSAPLADKEAFLEEIIVRRELSDNFCYYNRDYNNVNGFPDWAKQSLKEHQSDKREYVYSLRQFASARTHDPLWNAAQIEMVRTGKMHGFLRMYWAKKILEWTNTPQEALRIAIHLNDRFSLDGRDPNGYVGILWSIGGLHDRAWFDRPVFGKVRYMNAAGCKRKFDVNDYIERWK